MNRPFLIALGTVFGLQSLRAFLPLLVYVLRDRFGLSSIQLGGVGLAIFATGLVFPALMTRRSRHAVATALLALIVTRAALQFWTGDPVGSLILAGGGVVMFVAFLCAVTGASRSSGVTLGVVLGLLLDTSVHSLFGTRDLHWGGTPETVIAVALLLAGIAGTVVALRSDRGRESRPAFAASPAALLAWGPFLLLHLEVFGNVARFSSRTGLPTAHSGAMVALGLALSLALAWRAASRPVPGRAGSALAAAILLISLTGVTRVGWLAWPLLVLGQGSAILLLGATLRRARTAAPASVQGLAFCGGLVLFLLLLFGHYAGYDLQLPGSRHGFLLTAAAVLAVLAVRPGTSSRSGGSSDSSADAERAAPQGQATPRLLFAIGALLVALPLGRPIPKAITRPLDDTFRVVSFNLHNGFDETGGCALRTMMSKLEASGPDVVALQEVSRGWVVNGSMDLYELSREALDMVGTPGPSVATDWGNAVFSRAPIESAVTRRLPPEDLPLPRAISDVRITCRDGESIRLLATHYHHLENDGPIREEHSRFIAAEFPAPAAWILLGDFNALPAAPCLSILARAGWSDVGGDDQSTALPTYPARSPNRRIDTILHGPGLLLREARVAPEWGSDHRAVIADLDVALF